MNYKKDITTFSHFDEIYVVRMENREQSDFFKYTICKKDSHEPLSAIYITKKGFVLDKIQAFIDNFIYGRE